MSVFHWLAVAAVSLAGCIILVAWLQSRWLKARAELDALQSQLAVLRKEQRLAMKASYGMGQRMLMLERKLKGMAEAPHEPPAMAEAPDFSYTQAAQMVEQGADEEAIAAACGLSRSEARLMQKLCERDEHGEFSGSTL